MTTDTAETLLASITPFSAPAISRLDTSVWFDATHSSQDLSPIDEFNENLAAINILYLQADARNEYTATLGGLVYLGMVSAAEGYFRSLLRRLILTDEMCAENAATRTVSYAAAVHHQPDLLPEALLEGVSLASKKNVAAELRTLCNISQMGKNGEVPPSLEKLFQNFEDICQVRHCGIHRFGKLGSQQALRLGMEKHKPLLEKPLRLTVTHLQDIAEALEALIRAVNSYCFFDMLKRTHDASPVGKAKVTLYRQSWTRDWESDRDRFTRFHSIFASTRANASSVSANVTYDAFILYVTAQESRGR